MSTILRALFITITFIPLLGAASGCASEQRGTTSVVRPVEPRAPAQARPAIPVEEERPWYENAGEVAVIIVGAIFIIGGIAGGIILATNGF